MRSENPFQMHNIFDLNASHVQVPKLWSSLDTQSEEMGLGGCEIAGSKPVCDTVQEYSVTPYPRCKS